MIPVQNGYDEQTITSLISVYERTPLDDISVTSLEDQRESNGSEGMLQQYSSRRQSLYSRKSQPLLNIECPRLALLEGLAGKLRLFLDLYLVPSHEHSQNSDSLCLEKSEDAQ